ncbi:hypothetical protein IAR50_004319 [Cryptococcus sp. DSM 104548]
MPDRLGRLRNRRAHKSPKKMIFTNSGTIITPDGTVHHLSSDSKQAVLDEVQSDIREFLRLELASYQGKVGMADMIHIRGYEECEVCRKVSRKGVQGKSGCWGNGT